MRCTLLSTCLAAVTVLHPYPSWAQITPDSTLNTTVTTTGLNTTITNGTAVGGNLFHSFGQFSIPTSGSATFDLVNTPNISTIFSRITGGSVSNIDGMIQTINSSNPVSLFLFNPAGILFGPNASLNISGSFVGTTANSIRFADGTEFSTTDLTATPLLTVSMPIGLQLGQNPGAIQVNGTGHQLISPSVFLPLNRPSNPTGLKVQPGKTLALVGGTIDLQGGVLTTEQGRVELGSVSGGNLVGLTLSPEAVLLNYTNVDRFQDIRLSRQAGVDVSGLMSGSIQVQGSTISMSEGSLLFGQNQGPETGGQIEVRAATALTLSGTTPNASLQTGIRNETKGSGTGGAILVSTPQLNILGGASINTRTFSEASGGNVYVNAQSIQLNGFSPLVTTQNSNIGTFTFGKGQAGDILVSTQQLSILNGGILVASSLSRGRGGNLMVNADSIEVAGMTSTFVPSGISASTLSSGDAGSITFNTRILSVRDSGAVYTSGFSSGKAGNLYINASERVEVIGRLSGAPTPSQINSAITVAPLARRLLLGLSDQPSGAAGSVIINTSTLSVTNQGEVSVQNGGIGNAGKLLITANLISLDSQGRLTAATTSGEGGNILLQSEVLRLRRNSTITTTAGGNGNGGNIAINAPIILGLENSDIIANANQGAGGNITITIQGIFGLKFRPQLTPGNDITASSRFGVNGIVQVNTIGVDPGTGLVELPVNLTDSNQQIAAGCAGNQGNQFMITGRGGIPDNPTQPVRIDRTWADTRDLSGFRPPRPAVPTAYAPVSSAIVEASTLTHINGQLELVAVNSPAPVPQTATCAKAIVPDP